MFTNARPSGTGVFFSILWYHNGMSAEIIIAAAGLSTRMGSWKPEVLYQGKPLIYHSLTAALETPWPVILVGGYNFQRLHSLVDDFLSAHPSHASRLTLVENPDFSLGPGETFLKGLEVSREEWLFLSLGDLPLLTAETFQKLYDLRRSPACRPVHNAKPGHPVLLNRSLVSEIFRRREGFSPVQGKELSMRQLVGAIHPIPWNDGSVVFDLDCPQVIKTVTKKDPSENR